MNLPAVLAVRLGLNSMTQPSSSTTALHVCSFVYEFTGKERDSESGLDYFGARYYGSALGRFSSPDWSAGPAPVPYANLGNPQTLNLYAYVANNPLSRSDLTGHNWWDKLKNLFGDAGCWCEGEQAESAALRNLWAAQRQQRQDLEQWRRAMKNPAYHIAMAMAMGPLGPAGEELESAAAETAAAEEAAEEEAGQMAAGEAKGYGEMAEQEAPAAEQTAKKIARQIQRDLGPEARREFHDAKENGAGDRTLKELRRDAKALYEEHGKTPPAWINK